MILPSLPPSLPPSSFPSLPSFLPSFLLQDKFQQSVVLEKGHFQRKVSFRYPNWKLMMRKLGWVFESTQPNKVSVVIVINIIIVMVIFILTS